MRSSSVVLVRVTTVTPMKRGLKVKDGEAARSKAVVTTVTPMKRGLKDLIKRRQQAEEKSYNRYPDEKGTESLDRKCEVVEVYRGYNRYPDEKGTERVIGHAVHSKEDLLQRYNRYPDEKGTESLHHHPLHLRATLLQPLPR